MRLSHLIGACALIATAITAQAHAAPSTASRDSRIVNSPACEAAKRSAWFDRQRQLTDGDVNPGQALPTPRECLAAPPVQAKVEDERDAASRTAQANAAAAQKGASAY